MKLLIALLSTVALLLVVPSFAEPVKPPVAGQRLFITAHSFHIFVAARLGTVVAAAGIPGHELVGKQMIGGSRVMQHWDLPAEKNAAKKALGEGRVDVLTMSPNWVVPDEAIEKFIDFGLEKNPKLRALVQVSWFPWDGEKPPLRVADNGQRDGKTVADLRAAYDPFRETIRTQLRAINARHAQPVAFVVPVGEAVLRLREKVIAGAVTGIARQSELFTDTIGHAKAPVQVLTTYCHFACLYRRSPVGLDDAQPELEKISPELKPLLQRLAWEVVLEEPMSGVTGQP